MLALDGDSRGPDEAEGAAGAPGSPTVCEVTGAEGGMTEEGGEMEDALPGPGPAGDYSASAEGTESQTLEFDFTVPFLTFLDAEIARRYLDPGEEPLRGGVHREFTVIGRDLVIRLTAENSRLLQISVASVLNQLSWVVQALQHFVPPFFLQPQPQLWKGD